MNEQDALQQYIDGKIPPPLQANYRDSIGLIRGGWTAAMSFRQAGQPIRRPGLSPEEEKTKASLIEFENRIKGLWEAGELPFLVHLCGGNEAQLIQIFRGVLPGDWVFSGHRSHYHYLLAGGSPEKLEEKIRRGDSMFVFDRDLNFFTSSVLASTCCIAAGVAWDIKMAAETQGMGNAEIDRIAMLTGRDAGVVRDSLESMQEKMKGSLPHVWCFLGDGAEDEGHFYEAVTFVEGHQLPCTFVVEDNDRSVDTSKARRGRHVIDWPPCVRRYHYTPTYPHAGSGCKHTITFNPNVRPV